MQFEHHQAPKTCQLLISYATILSAVESTLLKGNIDSIMTFSILSNDLETNNSFCRFLTKSLIDQPLLILKILFSTILD
jgi:hypothetical protein